MSLPSDDDPVHLEEEVRRMYLPRTPLEVRVEVFVDVATSGSTSESDQDSEFVTASTISFPSVPPTCTPINHPQRKPPHPQISARAAITVSLLSYTFRNVLLFVLSMPLP